MQSMCELPESYEAYRKQQHRWHSGPMQLFRLCLPDIITSKVGLSESLLIGLCPCQVQSLPWYFKSALRESYEFRKSCDTHSDFSLFLVCIHHAGISIEESKSHISLFPFEEIDTAFLFIHTLLHNPASDNVCP